MTLPPFLQSRKTWSCIVATVMASVPMVFGWSKWNADTRQAHTETYILAIAGIWGLNVVSQAYEDGQSKGNPSSGNQPPAPAQSNVTTVAVDSPNASAPSPAPAAGSAQATAPFTNFASARAAVPLVAHPIVASHIAPAVKPLETKP